jgi:hypothetical protein
MSVPHDEIEVVAEDVQTDGSDDVDDLLFGEAALAEALDIRRRHLAGSPRDACRELQRSGRLVVFRAPGSGGCQLALLDSVPLCQRDADRQRVVTAVDLGDCDGNQREPPVRQGRLRKRLIEVHVCLSDRGQRQVLSLRGCPQRWIAVGRDPIVGDRGQRGRREIARDDGVAGMRGPPRLDELCRQAAGRGALPSARIDVKHMRPLRSDTLHAHESLHSSVCNV